MVAIANPLPMVGNPATVRSLPLLGCRDLASCAVLSDGGIDHLIDTHRGLILAPEAATIVATVTSSHSVRIWVSAAGL